MPSTISTWGHRQGGGHSGSLGIARLRGRSSRRHGKRRLLKRAAPHPDVARRSARSTAHPGARKRFQYSSANRVAIETRMSAPSRTPTFLVFALRPMETRWTRRLGAGPRYARRREALVSARSAPSLPALRVAASHLVVWARARYETGALRRGRSRVLRTTPSGARRCTGRSVGSTLPFAAFALRRVAEQLITRATSCGSPRRRARTDRSLFASAVRVRLRVEIVLCGGRPLSSVSAVSNS